jgi:hypothetical protein
MVYDEARNLYGSSPFLERFRLWPGYETPTANTIATHGILHKCIGGARGP